METARRAAQLEIDALSSAVEQIIGGIEDAAELVLATPGKVLVTGSGTSSHVARRLAHLLSVTGTPAMFLHSMDALHGTVGAVQSRDVLIAISKTGRSREVVELSALVRSRGCKVIGISEEPDSLLAHESDVFVELSTVKGADAEETIAFGSTLVAALWGDALARALMEAKGWELQSSLDIHPAGGVGERVSLQDRDGHER